MSSILMDNISVFDYSRSHIESLNETIKLFDSDKDNNLDLFNYINCNNSDSNFLQSCRGLVYNGDKLIVKTFPYTIEYTEKNDFEEINKNILPVFDQCSFYNSHEGCLIRVFYFNNKWFMTTNKKLNAFKSKWASKQSYGYYFEEALKHQVCTNEKLKANINLESLNDNMENIFEVFCESILDKKNQYMFLLLNNDENRIVSFQPENPTIFHIGTFNEEHKIILENDIYIPYPEKLNFSNLDELFDYVDTLDYTKLQGVIIFAPENKQFKILNKRYHQYYLARGNEPSIKFRYLQVRMDQNNYNILRELYPENIKDFEDYENYIFDASRNIYKAYVERFIKKLYVTVPVEEYNVIKEAHSWYLSDRKSNKITYEKIMDILNSQSPTNLNKIIKRVKLGNNIISNTQVEQNNMSKKKIHKKILKPNN